MFVVPIKLPTPIDQTILGILARKHHTELLVQVGMLIKQASFTGTFYVLPRRIPIEIGVTIVKSHTLGQSWLHTRAGIRFNGSGARLLHFGPYCEDSIFPDVPLGYSQLIPRNTR